MKNSSCKVGCFTGVTRRHLDPQDPLHSCHRSQRSMSLGGPAHDALMSKGTHQPPQTVEMSRAENGGCLPTSSCRRVAAAE